MEKKSVGGEFVLERGSTREWRKSMPCPPSRESILDRERQGGGVAVKGKVNWPVRRGLGRCLRLHKELGEMGDVDVH